MKKKLSLLFLVSTLLFAAKGTPKPSCSEMIAGEATLRSSGRDADLLPKYQEVARLMFGKEGILTKLGIKHQPHVMHFLPGNEISYLVANNRGAVRHWHDGAEIARAPFTSGGVLEFVCPSGCPCRSFYKDTLSFEQQISIILHVSGHYHFMQHSLFSQMRDVDIFAESSELNDLLVDLYQRESPEDVSRWYQYLESLVTSQDWARGTRNDPSDFDPAVILSKLARPIPGELPPELTVPHQPTANILQAYVANLPRELPQWKRDVAVKFERIYRSVSALPITKITNEGFATIMQELAVEHLPYPYNSFSFGMEYSHLHQGVTVKSLNNPYWLGREIFRSIRRQFNARPENQGLEPLERDRRFIEYATKEIIESTDQYEAILKAFDLTWFREQKLALIRPVDWDEYDDSLPPPEDEDLDTQWRVVSKDPKELSMSIAHKVAEVERHMPRVFLTHMTDPKTGAIALDLGKDTFAEGVPLKRSSTVATLYVHSRIHRRPVQLDTVAASTWIPRELVWDDDFFLPQPRIRWGWPRPTPQEVTTSPIRITVFPDGEVVVQDKNVKDGTERLQANEILAKDLKKRLDKFRADLDLGGLAPVDGDAKVQLTMDRIAASAANSVPTGLMFHAPTAAGALQEYYSFLRLRMALVMDQALKGQRGLVRLNVGVAVKALPDIPGFEFDRSAMKALKDQATPKTKPDIWQFVKSPFVPEDTYGIGQTGSDVGDNIWGPNPNDEDGDGDSDDDGQPRRPGRTPGDGQGFDPSDPSWVVIPPDLYAEFLGEKIKLPRLRPKSGVSPITDRMKDGTAAKRDGESVAQEIARRALWRALGESRLQKRNGEEDENQAPVSRADMLRRGFKRLTQQDWRVRSYDDEPNPDINAVVFFMLDGSGSMGGERLRVAKKLVYDLKAILKKHYKKLEFRFVTFDTRATIHDNEDEFFRLELLGGTNYVVGLQRVIDEEKKFSRTQWDRYAIGVGDMEDGGVEEIIAKFKELASETEFSGMVRTAGYEGGSWDELAQGFQALAQQDPYIGYLDLPNLQYSPSDFKKLFKNEE